MIKASVPLATPTQGRLSRRLVTASSIFVTWGPRMNPPVSRISASAASSSARSGAYCALMSISGIAITPFLFAAMRP